MARQYYKDSTTGQMKPIGVKVEDTLPVGTEVDYDGSTIPEGWEEVDDPNEYSTSEKVIGTHLGKPLYRKTITYTGALAVGNNQILSDSTIKYFVNAYGGSNYGNIVPSNKISFYYGGGVLYISADDTYGSRTWYINIEYVRTTD